MVLIYSVLVGLGVGFIFGGLRFILAHTLGKI
jgi:hypothetical protein